MKKEKTIEEIFKELAESPKFQKAMKGLLSPLKQKSDSLTISSGDEKVEIKFEEIPQMKGTLEALNNLNPPRPEAW